MRLFVALQLDQSALEQAWHTRQLLRRICQSGIFTQKENLHLTLAFLGDSLPLEKATAALSAIKSEPFPVMFERLGSFWQRDGELCWLGVQKNLRLEALQVQVVQALQCQGFEPDKRPFRPHLTLGRRVEFVAGAKLEDLAGQISAFASMVEEIHLMNSERMEGKLVYTPLYQKNLEG